MKMKIALPASLNQLVSRGQDVLLLNTGLKMKRKS